MHIGFTVAAGCATITEVLYFFIFWSYFMVKICCDSTADLLNEVHGTNLYSQRGVTVMPLYVQIGDEEYRDGVDITMRELLKRCGEAKTLPKTLHRAGDPGPRPQDLPGALKLCKRHLRR